MYNVKLAGMSLSPTSMQCYKKEPADEDGNTFVIAFPTDSSGLEAILDVANSRMDFDVKAQLYDSSPPGPARMGGMGKPHRIMHLKEANFNRLDIIATCGDRIDICIEIKWRTFSSKAGVMGRASKSPRKILTWNDFSVKAAPNLVPRIHEAVISMEWPTPMTKKLSGYFGFTNFMSEEMGLLSNGPAGDAMFELLNGLCDKLEFGVGKDIKIETPMVRYRTSTPSRLDASGRFTLYWEEA